MSWSWCQVIPDLVAGYLVHLVRGPRYLVRGLQLVAVARRPGGRAGRGRRARTWWPCLHPRPGGRRVFACHVQTGPPAWCGGPPAADQVHLVRAPGGRAPGSLARGPRPADQVPRPADQVARTTARAAWRASEGPLTGVQKTAAVAGCAGFSPISHGMCCTKQFLAMVSRESFKGGRKRGPLCQQTQLVSKFAQFQNQFDPAHDP